MSDDCELSKQLIVHFVVIVILVFFQVVRGEEIVIVIVIVADGVVIKIEDHVGTSAGTTIVTARHGVGTETVVIVARGLVMALLEVGYI